MNAIEIKNLTAPFAKVQEIEGVWVPMELTMRSLQLETFTTLTITDLEPNPKLHRKIFDLSRLESH